MNEASSMCSPTTCAATHNAISSPASADGATRSGSPDGQMTDLFGQAVAPASRFLAQPEVGALAGKTSAICGPIGAASSLNGALALSLANRLPRPAIGSMVSAMTWKQWITPSGRRFCRLAVSVSTMRAIGSGLSATPTATANQSCPSMQKWPGCRAVTVTPELWRARMGYPAEWDDCAPTETRSSLKSRRNSSAP